MKKFKCSSAALLIFLASAFHFSAVAQDTDEDYDGIQFPTRTDTATDTIAGTPAAADTTAGNLPAADTTAGIFPLDSGKAYISLVLPLSGVPRETMNNNLDFYCGALLAAKQLGEEGKNVVLNVFDYSLGQKACEEAQKSNIVIGPFRSADLDSVMRWEIKTRFIVSPLDHKADSLLCIGEGRLIQAATSRECQWVGAVDWFSEIADTTGANYIIISSNRDTISLNAAKKGLEMAGKKYKTCLVDVSHQISGWSEAYRAGVANCVILAITNEAVLNNAIRNLSTQVIRSKKSLDVFVSKKVLDYETIPTEDLHKISAHIVCPYYMDYKDSEILKFVNTYRSYFRGDPSQFSFHGHDLFYFLASTIMEYGADWEKKILEMGQSDLLESSFKFRRHSSGGLANYGVRRIICTPDFKITLKTATQAETQR